MDLDQQDDPLDPNFAGRFASDDRRPPCQLYLVAPPVLDTGFADRLRLALDGGPVAAFRFRPAGVDGHAAARAAEPLQRICADRDTAFIVDRSVSLAKRLGADGVHLGAGDDAREARDVLGPAVQIGVDAGDSRHRAMEAGEAGADYVSFGPFHPTDADGVRHRPELGVLSWWTTLFELPCVAWGGVTPANARPLVAAGSDFIAVADAVWAHAAGPGAAVAAFAAVLAA